MTPTCYIYKIENKKNHKCYIGYTTNFEKRKKDHLRFAILGIKGKFYNALRKYKEDSFTWSIVYISDDTEDTLQVMEQIFIDIYDSIVNGYNQKGGGKGGSKKGRVLPPRSAEERRKISQRQLGRKLSETTKRKISLKNKGKVRSPDVIRRLVECREKDRVIKDPCGKIHYFRSIKVFCEEWNLSRPDISKLLRGKITQYKGWVNVSA